MQKLAIIVLFVLAERSAAEPNLRRASRELAYQHRELGFIDAWYTLLNTVHMPCPLGHTDDTPKGHCAHRSHCGPTCKTEQADQVDEAEISDENSTEDTEEEGSDDSMTNWQTNNSNSDSSNTDTSIVGSGDSAKTLGIGALLAGLLVGIAAFMTTRVSMMHIMCTYISILLVLTFLL